MQDHKGDCHNSAHAHSLRFHVVLQIFPVVESGHKDEHALNVLASVIGQGGDFKLFLKACYEVQRGKNILKQDCTNFPKE